MIIGTLSRGQAQEAMKEWVENCPCLPQIDENFQQIRIDLQSINERVRKEIGSNTEIKRQNYCLDYNLGLLLYDYLSKQQGFTLRVAANDGFWRFLSVKIVPDIVAQRWGKGNHSHYWSQPTRIWLRSLWWFVYLSWQGTFEETKTVLSCNHFSTDTILQFEERTGRRGTHINAYRHIIKYYSMVPEDVLRRKIPGKKSKSDDIFRVVMKLNTARMLVIDPALYSGGEEAYARSLFRDVGVDFDAT
jgi:hypothetical protein